jgi:hypothetical protein
MRSNKSFKILDVFAVYTVADQAGYEQVHVFVRTCQNLTEEWPSTEMIRYARLVRCNDESTWGKFEL